MVKTILKYLNKNCKKKAYKFTSSQALLVVKIIQILQERRVKYDKVKNKLEEAYEKLERAKVREKELISKLTKEQNELKELKIFHKEQIQQIKSENVKLKGCEKGMKA